MAENINFTVSLSGDKVVLQALRKLDREAQKYDGKVIGPKVSAKNIDSLKKSLESANSELKRLSSRKITIKENINSVREKILTLRELLKEVQNKKANLKVGSSDYIKAESIIKRIKSEIDTLTNKKRRLELDTSKTTTAMQKMKTRASELAGEVSSIESAFNKVGASSERASARIGKSFQGIGKAMQDIGGVFGGNVVNTMKSVISGFGTMGLYNVLDGVVSRYDTMRKFPKTMEKVFAGEGASAKDIERISRLSEKAISDLNESVIGLPTSLDEIVSLAQQIIPLTGSIKRGTDLTIAMNNAMLAGGSDTQSQTFAKRQIADILSKGKLTSREWDSLFTGLGSSLGVIAEQMGYNGTAGNQSSAIKKMNERISFLNGKLNKQVESEYYYSVLGDSKKAAKARKNIASIEKELSKFQKNQEKYLGDFRSDLKDGTIDATDFLSALTEAGKPGGTLEERTGVQKDTIGATLENIKIAFQNLGASGLLALDQVLLGKTGKDLPNTIVEISDSIKQQLIPALQGWFEDNSDDIGKFIDGIKNYDFVGLVSKVAKELARYYKIIGSIFTKMPTGVISAFAVWFGPIGKAFQSLGSFLSSIATVKISSGILGKISTMKQATTALGEMGTPLSGLTKSFKPLMQGIGLSAAGIAVIGEVGLVIAEFAKVAQTVDNVELHEGFGKKLAIISGMFGASGGIVGGLTALMTAITTGTGGIGALAVGAGEGLVAGLVAIIGEVGLVVEQYAKTADTISNAKLPSSARWKQFGDSIKSLYDNVISNVKFTKSASKTAAKSLGYMNDSMDSILSITKSLAEINASGKIGGVSKKLDKIFEATEPLLSNNLTGDDKAQAKRLSIVSEYVAKAMGSAKKMAESLVDMRSNVNALFKNGKFDGYVDKLNQMLTAFDEIYSLFAVYSKGKYKRETANVENVAKSVEQTVGIVNNFSKIEKGLGELSTKKGSFTAVSGLKTFLEQINEAVMVFYNGTDYAGMVERTADIDTSLGSLKSVIETISSITEPLSKLTKSSKNGSEIENAIANIMLVVRGINDLANYITDDNIGVTDVLKDSIGTFANLANVSEYIGTMSKSLVTVSKDISTITGGGKFDTKVFSDTLGGMIKGVVDAFAYVPEDFTFDETSLESFGNMANAVKKISPMITQMSSIQTSLDGLGFEGNTWTYGEKLKSVMTSLEQAFGTGFTTDGLMVANLSSVPSQLEQIGVHLGTIGSNAGKAASGLADSATGVKKLGSNSNTYSGDIESVATAVSQLKTALSGIGTLGVSASNGITSAGTAASNQVSSFQSAASAASSLASAIASIPSEKKVGITTTVGGVIGKILGSFHNGGTVYRAGGGSIFRPKGTDTVPAMLTPGEFVIRKRSASALGAGFLNRINNMDIDGALRALTVRAGAGVFRTSHVNNYSRDNHATVTQNIYNASQGYSQRRASRWARSLT